MYILLKLLMHFFLLFFILLILKNEACCYAKSVAFRISNESPIRILKCKILDKNTKLSASEGRGIIITTTTFWNKGRRSPSHTLHTLAFLAILGLLSLPYSHFFFFFLFVAFFFLAFRLFVCLFVAIFSLHLMFCCCGKQFIFMLFSIWQMVLVHNMRQTTIKIQALSILVSGLFGRIIASRQIERKQRQSQFHFLFCEMLSLDFCTQLTIDHINTCTQY